MIVISTKNTSTVALASGATFTGIAEDVSQYSSIRIPMLTGNVASGTLYIGFSSNGTAWTETPTFISNPSTQAPIFVKVVNTYFRIRYVNGSTAQSSFRIQSEFTGQLLNGAGIGGGSSTLTQVRQIVPITSSMITSKSISLDNAPINPANVDVVPAGGPKQIYGVDFTVVSTLLSWNGLGLDGFLDTSDTLEITYLT